MCNDDGCCYGTSRCYVGTLNTISFIAGVVLFCLSFYLVEYFKDYEDPIVVGVGVWGPLIISIVMILVGFFGLCGTCCLGKHRICAKCSLSFFLILSIVLWSAVLVTSTLLFVYVSTAGVVAYNPPFHLEGAAENLNTWELAVWNKCCYESYPDATIEVNFCGSNVFNLSGSDVALGCANQIGNGLLCSCYMDEELYDSIASRISAEQCQVWEDITFKGNQWVGGMLICLSFNCMS
mmetsp:Transcript_14060/g.17061  ORF Transcript_14060/g.17061 Transcript_14060/m.17061 type:complete len:236 (+) Transcript_14060:104-811(+)